MKMHHKLTCNFCGSNSWKLILNDVRDINLQTTKSKFQILKCLSCGLMVTNPLPERISIHYPLSYYGVQQSIENFLNRGIQYESQIEKYTLVARIQSPGKLIDIGCGFGGFLKVAEEYGWECIGVEISEGVAALGMKRLRVNILVADFLCVDLCKEELCRGFDLCTMWHSLEHISNPRRALERVFRLLKPGGGVVIAVPNPQSFQAKIFKQRWVHWDIPRHLYHFSPVVLTTFLKKIGFKVQQVSFFSNEHNPYGIQQSLKNLCSLSHYRKVITKLARLACVAARLESMVGHGGTFTVYAEK